MAQNATLAVPKHLATNSKSNTKPVASISKRSLHDRNLDWKEIFLDPIFLLYHFLVEHEKLLKCRKLGKSQKQQILIFLA